MIDFYTMSGYYLTTSSFALNAMTEKLIKYARHLRQNMTDTEQRLWQYLRRKQVQGLRFRRQFIITPYIVDFACLNAKVIIKCDGGQHQQNHHYNRQRDSYLQSQGFQVLRFWNHEILTNMDGVWQIIDAACRRHFPPS